MPESITISQEEAEYLYNRGIRKESNFTFNKPISKEFFELVYKNPNVAGICMHAYTLEELLLLFPKQLLVHYLSIRALQEPFYISAIDACEFLIEAHKAEVVRFVGGKILGNDPFEIATPTLCRIGGLTPEKYNEICPEKK